MSPSAVSPGAVSPSAGPALAVRTWWPASSPRAHLALVHGYAEHGGRYDGFARRLAERGIAVHAPDLPGHGRSPGVRGDLANADRLVRTVRAFASSLEGPRFLLGHSVGGAISVLAAADATGFRGLVLSSPYVRNAVPVPDPVVRLARWLARLAPYVPVRRLDPSDLSRIEAEVRSYRQDPLVYTGRIRARAGTVMLSLADAALDAAVRVTTPTMIVYGDEDRIAAPEGARVLATRLRTPDVRLDRVAGGYHEPLNDLDRERVAADILDWIEART